MSSLDISTKPSGDGDGAPRIRRLNRLPVIAAIALAILFFGVIIYGLSQRGLYFRGGDGIGSASNSPPARDFADQLKRGVSDGVIEAPVEPSVFRPSPPPATAAPLPANPFKPAPTTSQSTAVPEPAVEPERIWRARLQREQEEQYLRERHRQRMARLQANDAAYDSPISVGIGDQRKLDGDKGSAPDTVSANASRAGATDLYAAAMRAGLAGQAGSDANRQGDKAGFFNQDIKDLGYLPNRVVPQLSPYELKRGSVIPATLITGVNSDLPGRITAQVSQNVFDSATGHHLLVPQGAKLFGRYDSSVTFGQRRVLVVWTEVIFPNGATLQIEGMAGTDAQGHGGFKDRVNNHYLRTFGSAILIAAIGAGVDMAIPEDRNALGSENSAENSARRSFAETFGRVAERAISKNIDVQPTLEIRPGYKFNILVDQDIVFPRAYSS
ncbi:MULTISPECIES: IncP-type conjugal transfer protein TrbI [unclassified Mesorhizobium]|uniref:IncP-type conjugal transfer protein TrbI n=1 Tax=unclassified Mesorhizobium TaxID=325217 RepID=UPI00112667DF|nr:MULTISPECIES: IncP-type conjugal transfer protein TrbI [unclassified Mesorhizobium]MBZ9898302.1 IncP-type conjugal transfer protein TrbI [Mesorhizobium sp. BR1-1-6]TPM57393.1 conjugal transfer protein TrbI [Mesorhizobium sp. B2-2-4]TPM65803.1 conjugal transfer protein TrbI [Mesorhizobium sp. B2-2-1]TPN30490.1 conjugal transfer protein TrbI [Mesorhizobium sp. B1-1-6]TPN72129.1 conjugal transfer protein TrbI [Mesorhizobium sp. B1-1-3]